MVNLSEIINKDTAPYVDKLDNFTQANMLGFLSGEIFDKKRLHGYRLPYKQLSELIGGVRLGTLTILAGATNMGKSLISLNLAVDLAKTNVPVCYIDLENGVHEVLERVTRIWYGVDAGFLDKAENEAQFQSMVEELHDLELLNHEILGNYARLKKSTLSNVVKAVIDKRSSQGYKVFFVDPLQALEESLDSSRNLNEQGKIVEGLKNVAQKNNVAIVLNHHIRKSTFGGGSYLTTLDETDEPKYRIPTLDDLKGSAKISDFATDVWAIVRTNNAKTPKHKGRTLFRVLKSRRKGTGDVQMYLDLENLKLWEWKDIQHEVESDFRFNATDFE